MRIVRVLAPTFWISLAASAQAATVAVIDSGVDYRHADLSPRIWTNAHETADNGADDDSNGYADDIYGWNFADGNNQVIDYSHLGTFSEDCYRFFQVQGRVIQGTATQADRDWLEQKRADAQFVQELNRFGNFVHGSHVAGIASGSRSTERLISVKIIGTPAAGAREGRIEATRREIAAREETDPLTKLLIKWFIDSLVDQQVGVIVQAGEYVARAGADVANGSFGVSYGAASEAIKGLLQTFLGREPTEDEVKEYTTYMIDRINDKCRGFVRQAPNTLFVFAAGNDAGDNDAQAMAPANLGEPNTLSVAATLGLRGIASFSNFGAAKVDVAAPGVVINSTVPGDRYLEMSGTSMAAPYVTEVAALVKDANPALTAVEIRKILVETVDVKAFLAGKVKSSGIVNSSRAVRAGHLSRDHDVPRAIELARSQVADAEETVETARDLDDREIIVAPLPSLIDL